MANYRVLSPIQMGRLYAAGETIELSEEQAAAMPWAVEALPEKSAEKKMKKPPKE